MIDSKEKELLIRWQIRFFKFASICFVLMFLCLFIYICNYFHEITSIIGYSILISYLLIGLVDWLQTKIKLKNRGLIVIIVYLFLLLLLVLFGLFIFPIILNQLKSLVSQLPSIPSKLDELLLAYNLKTTQIGLPAWNINWTILSQQIIAFINNFSSSFISRFWQLAFGTISFAIHLLTTVVLSAYFLFDGPKIWSVLISPFSSDKYKKHADNLRLSLNRCLKAYFLGQIQLSSLSGLIMFFVYIILGSKYALLLGIWHALVEILPVVGGFLGIGLGVTILIFDSPIKALIALIIYFAYTQIIKDNFLAPRIMSDAIGLHPVIVLLVVLIGSHIGGISGVIFALPVAGLLNVIFEYYLAHRENA